MDIIKINISDLSLQIVKKLFFNYSLSTAKISIQKYFFIFLFRVQDSFLTFTETLYFYADYLSLKLNKFLLKIRRQLKLNVILIENIPFNIVSFLSTPKTKKNEKFSYQI